MEIRQLRFFLAVAEFSSLTAAANHLGVTQPAVGLQIRALEDSLGVKLMVRHSRGIRLTSAGVTLLRHANEIVEGVEAAKQSMKQLQNAVSGKLTIGVTPSLSMVFVPKLMDACQKKYPDLSLIFFQGFPKELTAKLNQGELNFSFTNKDIDTKKYESIPLYREELRLIGETHAIQAVPDPVPMEQLANLPLVLDGRDEELAALLLASSEQMDLKFADIIKVPAVELRRAYATQRSRFCIAPAALFHAEISSEQCAVRSLELPQADRCLQLAGPRVENMTKAESIVRRIAVEIIDKMVASGQFDWRSPADSA